MIKSPTKPKQSRNAGYGVVNYYVQGFAATRGTEDFSAAKIVQALEVGLPVHELVDLQLALEAPVEKLAPLLGISKATFHRRKGEGSRLQPAVSDRVVRFARLLGKAGEIFGDKEDAKKWLNSPQFGLGGAVPLDFARTEVGAREVENLLGRIEHGVYS
jgi:putative toxin-antitoxin system antitoxin component (TIGR02293 family)